MNEPADRIATILAMVMETPQMKFLQRKMEEREALGDCADEIADWDNNKSQYTARAASRPERPSVERYTEADVSALAIRLHSACIRRGGKQMPYSHYEAGAIRRLEARGQVERYTEPAGFAEQHERTLAAANRVLEAVEPEFDRIMSQLPGSDKYAERLSQESIRVHGEIVRRENRQPTVAECERIATERLKSK